MSSATSSATPSGRRSWQGSSPLPGPCRQFVFHNSFFPFIISPPRTAPVIRTFSGAEMSFYPSPSLFLCFSVSKSSKSHPTDSDVGVRKSESGVGRLFAGLQANRPRRCRFQPSVHSFAIGTKSGIALRKKERRTAGWRFQEKLVDTGFRGALPYINNAAVGGTINPHSRLTRRKRVRAAARSSRGGAKA